MFFFYSTQLACVGIQYKPSKNYLNDIHRSLILNMMPSNLQSDDIILLCLLIFWLFVFFCCLGPCLMVTNSIKNKWRRYNRRLIYNDDYIDDRIPNTLAPPQPRQLRNIRTEPPSTPGTSRLTITTSLPDSTPGTTRKTKTTMFLNQDKQSHYWLKINKHVQQHHG